MEARTAKMDAAETDNGTGTSTLPPPGGQFVSPRETAMIVDGLPPETTIELDPSDRFFFCQDPQCGVPGGALGGERQVFDSYMRLELRGTGSLLGFRRTLTVPTLVETHTGPRQPDDPVQRFDTEIANLQGILFGDEWHSWAEDVTIEEGELVVTMPRQRGSAQAWIRPQPGEEIGYEIRTEPLATPQVLGLVSALESFLRSRDEVGGVLGPASYLETVGYVLRPEDASSRRLPDSAERARILWNNYTRIRGRQRLVHLVDEDYGHGVITAYVGGASYRDTRRLIAAIREWSREHLEPHGLELRLAGDLAVSTSLVRGVVSTQLRSLFVSLLLVLAIAAALFRRGSWGLLCVLPPLLAVLFNFGLMGSLGIPLGVATSMFAGMTLGVGVDFAIHLLHRYRHELDSGATRETGLTQALRITGPAILIDGCAVGIGFGVLVLSVVPANARLGALLSLSVLHCLLASLVLLPAVLGLLATGLPLSRPSRPERPADGRDSRYRS